MELQLQNLHLHLILARKQDEMEREEIHNRMEEATETCSSNMGFIFLLFIELLADGLA